MCWILIVWRLRCGINIGDIRDLVETALARQATSELWEGEKHFSVVVRLKSQACMPNLPSYWWLVRMVHSFAIAAGFKEGVSRDEHRP
jgi:hypothetical protein